MAPALTAVVLSVAISSESVLADQSFDEWSRLSALGREEIRITLHRGTRLRGMVRDVFDDVLVFGQSRQLARRAARRCLRYCGRSSDSSQRGGADRDWWCVGRDNSWRKAFQRRGHRPVDRRGDAWRGRRLGRRQRPRHCAGPASVGLCLSQARGVLAVKRFTPWFTRGCASPTGDVPTERLAALAFRNRVEQLFLGCRIDFERLIAVGRNHRDRRALRQFHVQLDTTLSLQRSIFRASVGCVWRPSIRVDEWPEISISA